MFFDAIFMRQILKIFLVDVAFVRFVRFVKTWSGVLCCSFVNGREVMLLIDGENI